MTSNAVLNTKTENKTDAEQKEQNLRSLMRNLKSVLVAYSGGVDSTYLALIATQELGEKAICLTGISPSVAEIQRDQAKRIAREYNFNHEFINTDELSNPDYQSNPTNRCYFCKSELYGKLSTIAQEKHIEHILDGANADDLNDYRPGSQAAIEKNVISPLAQIGFTKQEIREQSKKQNLETWEKPASPCLASRIQYGIPVSIERLSKVEQGEEILRNLGFKEFRVRIHDELVRIEISPVELEKALNKEITEKLAKSFQALGFKYTTLDLQGFRSGAMNEILESDSTQK
jgi:uncharacterized protein